MQTTSRRSAATTDGLGDGGRCVIDLIQMGGTIDKDYPKQIAGYRFEIFDSAAHRILAHFAHIASGAYAVRFHSVCRKDSLDLNDEDLRVLTDTCRNLKGMKILITHGTDRLLDTAAVLAGANLCKVIVMTGSFKPERFKGSDAEFNVGVAFGAVQVLKRPGVYVAINGFVSDWSKVRRDSDSGHFFVVS